MKKVNSGIGQDSNAYPLNEVVALASEPSVINPKETKVRNNQKNNSKKRITEITAKSLNNFPLEIYGNTLLEIYARKIKDGVLCTG